MRCFSLLVALVLILQTGWAWALEKAPPTPVHFRISESNHIIVRAKVNDKGPFHFILDTGAPVTFLSEEAGKTLDLKPDEKGWCKLNTLVFEGGIRFENQNVRLETPFQIRGMNGIGLAGMEIHGLIGYDILAQFKILLDVSKSKMTWERTGFLPKVQFGPAGKSAPSNLESLGALMKAVGALVKASPPRRIFIGNLGLLLEEKNNQVHVQGVVPGSKAENAKFHPDDILAKCQGKSLAKSGDIQEALKQPTTKLIITMEILRKGKTIELQIPMDKESP